MLLRARLLLLLLHVVLGILLEFLEESLLLGVEAELRVGAEVFEVFPVLSATLPDVLLRIDTF